MKVIVEKWAMADRPVYVADQMMMVTADQTMTLTFELKKI